MTNPGEAAVAESYTILRASRRLAAAVVAAGALVSGCISGSSGSEDKGGGIDTGGLAALGTMDELTGSLYADAMVTAELRGVASDQDEINQADRIIGATTHLNPAVRIRLTKMTNLRAGEVYLAGIGSDIQNDPDLDPKVTLPGVAPAEEQALLATVAAAATAKKVDSRLSQDSTDPKRFDAARRVVVTSRNPNATQRELLRYIDGEQVDAAFQDFNDFSGDPAAALHAINALHDPALKRIALSTFQTTMGKNLLNRLNLKEITRAQAAATAGKYLAARPDLRAAINAWTAPHDYVSDGPINDLETEFYDDSARLREARSSLPLTLPDFVERQVNSLDRAYTATATEVDGLLGRMVAAHNRLAVGKGRAPQELAPLGIDPRTPIDLTGVSGEQTGLDLGDFDPSSNGANSIYNPNELPAYNEFASVTMENGEPVLTFRANDKLTDEAKRLITLTFNRVRPLLIAAFTSGELQRVRLTIADDFNPYFHSMTREEIMALPANDSTSVEQFAAAWTHETVHSLVRNVFYGNALNKRQTAMVLQACTALKATLYERMETTVTTSHTQLAAIEAKLKPAHRVIITELERLAKTGRLDDKLIGTLSASRYDDINSNDCKAADTILSDAISTFAAEHDISFDDIDYLFDLPEFTAFSSTYYTQVIDRNIYKKLNEANYVRTDWRGRELLGHSEDNANELSATIIDAVLNFGPELGTIIHDMEPDEKKAALQTIDMAVRIVMAQHPELTGIVMEAVVLTRKAAA